MWRVKRCRVKALEAHVFYAAKLKEFLQSEGIEAPMPTLVQLYQEQQNKEA